jgi:phage gp36-like protein
MSYFTLSDIAPGRIPLEFATQALDDDRDGVIDAFDAVQAEAERMVDALLESRFSVPFDPVPAKIKGAAVVFACWLLFVRRQYSEEQNPFTKEKLAIEKKLAVIEAGELGLSTAPTAQQPATDAGSLIEYDSPLGSPGRTLG